MYLKKCWKYFLCFLIALFVIFAFILVTTPINVNNETAYFDILGLKIYDLGSLVALIVGILAFFGTIYSVDRNYKSMKLSSLPEKSTNLLIDLEFVFNEYLIYKKQGNGDEFIVLTIILTYWKEHQKAFRLLTPHFYKEFLKIITSEYNDEIEINHGVNNQSTGDSSDNLECENYVNQLGSNETNNDYSSDNTTYILNAITAQITNIAFENDENYFSFIKPELIEDNINIKEYGEDLSNYTKFKFSENNFKKYIDEIKGDKTRKSTERKFTILDKKFKKLLEDLKKEIEEYD